MNVEMHGEKEKVFVPEIESQSNQAFHNLGILPLRSTHLEISCLISILKQYIDLNFRFLCDNWVNLRLCTFQRILF